MSKIQSVKNVTIYNDLGALGATGRFNQNLNLNNQPSECIVRSISYCGYPSDTPGMYLIWSSIINDYIGSFAVKLNGTAANYTSNVNMTPQTLLTFQNPTGVNNQVQFIIMTIENGTGLAIAVTNQLIGELAIGLDFIQYKK